VGLKGPIKHSPLDPFHTHIAGPEPGWTDSSSAPWRPERWS